MAVARQRPSLREVARGPMCRLTPTPQPEEAGGLTDLQCPTGPGCPHGARGQGRGRRARVWARAEQSGARAGSLGAAAQPRVKAPHSRCPPTRRRSLKEPRSRTPGQAWVASEAGVTRDASSALRVPAPHRQVRAGPGSCSGRGGAGLPAEGRLGSRTRPGMCHPPPPPVAAGGTAGGPARPEDVQPQRV